MKCTQVRIGCALLAEIKQGFGRVKNASLFRKKIYGQMFHYTFIPVFLFV